MLGVHVYLFSEDPVVVPCPLQVSVDNPALPGRLPLCTFTTSSSGTFTFSNLPCGRYTLVPFSRGEVTVFEVTPKQAEVDVGQGDHTLEVPFQVGGGRGGEAGVGCGG